MTQPGWYAANKEKALKQGQAYATKIKAANDGRWERRRAQASASRAKHRLNNPDAEKITAKSYWTSPRGKIIVSLGAAKRRCCNPTHSNWKNYGGKGILYLLDDCREEAIAKLLPGYTEMLANGIRPSIDRIDRTKHYSLDNIRALPLSVNSKKLSS